MKEILEELAAKGVAVHLMFQPADQKQYRMKPLWSCFIEWRNSGDEVKVSRSSEDLDTVVESATTAFNNLAWGGLGQALIAPPEEKKVDDSPF